MPKSTIKDLQNLKNRLDKKLAEIETEVGIRRHRQKGVYVYSRRTIVRPEQIALEIEALEALKSQFEAQRAQVLSQLASADYARASGEYVVRPRGWTPDPPKPSCSLIRRITQLARGANCQKGFSVPGPTITEWRKLLNAEGFRTTNASIRATLSDLGYAKERRNR